MKTTRLFLTLTAGLLGFAVTAVKAGEPALKVGDPAPKLQTGKWIQGDPVTHFDKGKAYIVEFWATWCGPCRVTIPHLNEIHSRFKERGLIVIGQDCWENDESLVQPFVKKMGDKMTYRVVLDDKEGSEKGKMAETWMTAAGQNGIPTAFIVDTNGVVAWIGHPMGLKDETIDAVLTGTHDLKKALAEFLEGYRRNEQWMAAQIPLSKVRQAMQKKDWADAEAKLAEADKVLTPEDREGWRMQIMLGKRDYAAAYELAEKAYRRVENDASKKPSAAGQLNEAAWRMAIDNSISGEDLRRAETLAKWADSATGNKNPMILDTLARVEFRLGHKAEAIRLQEKAVTLAQEEMRDQLDKTLASYRKGELPPAQ